MKSYKFCVNCGTKIKILKTRQTPDFCSDGCVVEDESNSLIKVKRVTRERPRRYPKERGDSILKERGASKYKSWEGNVNSLFSVFLEDSYE